MLAKMILISMVLSLAAVAAKDTVVNFEGHRILRITPHDQVSFDVLNEMNALALDWEVNFLTFPRAIGVQVDVMVPGHQLDKMVKHLEDNSVRFSVHVDNVQRLVEEEKASMLEKADFDELSVLPTGSDLKGQSFNLFTYNRIDKIQAFVRDLCKEDNEKCKLLNIGQSYEKRDMLVMKIGSGCEDKPSVWIDGGIHAREWISPATALFMITKFMEDTPEMEELLEKVNVYIMPNANPDGYEYTHTHDRYWRKTRQPHGNCYGADPNRNWDQHFGGAGTSSNPCDSTYHGPHAFSEPEVKSISDFLYKHRRNMLLYSSMHSYSQVWLYPWSYDKTVPAGAADLQRLGDIAAAEQLRVTGLKYGVGQTSYVMYSAAGSSHDWAYDAGNATYAISVELPDTGRHGFLLPRKYIKPTGEGMVAAMVAMINEAVRMSAMP